MERTAQLSAGPSNVAAAAATVDNLALSTACKYVVRERIRTGRDADADADAT